MNLKEPKIYSIAILIVAIINCFKFGGWLEIFMGLLLLFYLFIVSSSTYRDSRKAEKIKRLINSDAIRILVARLAKAKGITTESAELITLMNLEITSELPENQMLTLVTSYLNSTIGLEAYALECKYFHGSEYIHCAVHPISNSCEGCKSYESKN